MRVQLKIKDKVIENYYIDTETAEVFDSSEKSLEKVKNTIGRYMVTIPLYGKYYVYQLMAWSNDLYKTGTIIHHKNFNKLDDRLSNLIVCKSESDHQRLHKGYKRVPKVVISNKEDKEYKIEEDSLTEKEQVNVNVNVNKEKYFDVSLQNVQKFLEHLKND